MNLRKVIKVQSYTLKLVRNVSKKRLLFSAVLNIANGVMEFIGSAFLISYVMNSFSKRGNIINTVCVIVAIAILKLIINIINSFYENIYVEKSNLKIKKYVQELIYNRSFEISMKEFDNPKFYDTFVKVLEKTSSTIFEVLRLFEEAIRLISYSIIASYFIYKINSIFILFLMVPIIAGGFVSKKITNIDYFLYEKNQKEERRRSYIFRVFYMKKYENDLAVTGIGNLLINKYIDSSKKIQKHLGEEGKKRWKLQYYFYLSNEIVTDLSIYIYATYEVLITKRLLLGDFFLVIDSLGDVSQSIKRIVSIIIKINADSRYLHDFIGFVEYTSKAEKEDFKKLPNFDNLNFSFDNVSFKYSNNQEYSLKDINLKISSGDKIAIVGENGSGKSTLIRLLLGFDKPTKGKIFCNGQDISEVDYHKYRNMFSVIFQNFQLFPFSINQNITLNNDYHYDPKVIDILCEVGLLSKVETFKKGDATSLFTDFDDDGVELSYGEKQRLAIARSIYQEKKILVMDEPTSAMDPISESNLFDLIRRVYKRNTVIFVTHRLSTISNADKIIYLKNGEFLEIGNHSELMLLDGEYAKKFKIQSENYLNNMNTEVYQ